MHKKCRAVVILNDFPQIQFTGAMILGINGIRNGCDFPLWMQYALVIYMISFIVLFGNFYARVYLDKGKKNWQTFCEKNNKEIMQNNNRAKTTKKQL